MQIKKFSDYNNLSDDIELIKIDGEKLDFKEFEIESIIDIITLDTKSKLSESITTAVATDGESYKRGDIIYITALLRKKGTSSFNSPAVQGVLKLRITDIYYGLQLLNKVIN